MPRESKRKRKGRIFRILGWIVAGFLGFVLLLTGAFYVGRGWLMERAVVRINREQPGELTMGQMNLIPFMNFPNVSLQLKSVAYYERKNAPDSLHQEPILSLNEVFVTLDVVQLIKGKFLVSESTLKDGFIRGIVYPDSVTNMEYALGIRFGEPREKDTLKEPSPVRIELNRIALSNLLLLYEDRTSNDRISLAVNRLDSRFSYLGERIHAVVDLEMDINYLYYLTYQMDDARTVSFTSEIALDLAKKVAELQPSMLKISGLELETWGSYAYLNEPHVDLAFRAHNEGLEVLNFLFRGVLDLDEIEQIGSGSIFLSGNVTGSLEDQLPVVRINGTADRIGFRIKSIQNDVTDISFRIYFSNGGALDFSDGEILVEDFTATFPEGTLQADFQARDFTAPEVDLRLNGAFDLEGLEQALKAKEVDRLEGSLAISGEINGAMDRNSGHFLNDAGRIEAELSNVGLWILQDSGRVDSIQNLFGKIYFEEELLGAEGLKYRWNGNLFNTTLRTENLLQYLLGFNKSVRADISVGSDLIESYSVSMDSSTGKILGDTLKNVYLQAHALIPKTELDRFLKEDSIPEFQVSVDSFCVDWPLYANVKDLETSLTLGSDTLFLHYLNSTLGSSNIRMAGRVDNYAALADKKLNDTLGITFDITSDRMRAEDLLMVNGGFLLPEIYRKEQLRGFGLHGYASIPVAGLVDDSTALDFGLDIRDMDWRFRYYPHPFEQFRIRARRQGNQLYVDNFQGYVGESNVKLAATIGNFTDTLIERMYGNLVLESDLLDINALMNYELPEEDESEAVSKGADTSEAKAPPRLDEIEYPRFEFAVDIGELRYGEYKIFGMDGKFRSTPEKIIFLDHLATSAESGGTMEFFGQFNVANPYLYTFSTEVDLEGVSINDLDIEMQSGDEIYTLKQNFQGRVTAKGLAEIFITPDMKVDMSTTTAVFDLKITDGAIINFTPLLAAGKYLDNRDLSYVRFNTLQQFGFTLLDSRIIIPLMNIESTAGQLLIEGEQGLDNSYLYIVRVPPSMAREAAQSVLSSAEGKAKNEEIQQMKGGRFIQITVWSDGVESDFKLGDRRDRFQQ